LLISLIILGAAIAGRIIYARFVARPAISTPVAAQEASSPDQVARLQSRLHTNPDDTQAYAELGLALLQQVRQTGDITLYSRADEAFTAALDRAPKQLDALVGKGILALALHDFQGALDWADQAWSINPFRAQILGVKVDALVELGRYAEAVEMLQQMVDLRPDLHSYTRISYLRELHGDTAGAIDAMHTAATMGVPGNEQWLWTVVQLGHLYWNSGQLAEAEQIYRQALQYQADYPYALAGMARIQAAQGDRAGAIAQYEILAKRLPLPEFVIALGELYEADEQLDKAQEQYDLVHVMQQLNASQGMNIDLELAAFDVDHGQDPAAALAQAQAAYVERPTIYAAGALAWAYYRTGDYTTAAQYSQEALRLGTQDALLHHHAGVIALALKDEDDARTHLTTALEINPHFSALYTPETEMALQQLVTD
jgi:tetratricopeptide (TPR) repeat protein